MDEIDHSTVDVSRLTEFLFHTHQHCFAGVIMKEGNHALQYLAKVCPLIRHPVVNGEIPLDVAHTDIKEAHASSELGGQTPGLALGVHTTIQSHGIVGPWHGDMREWPFIRDACHPGRVEKLGVRCIIIVWSLNSTLTQSNDSKTDQSSLEGKYLSEIHPANILLEVIASKASGV